MWQLFRAVYGSGEHWIGWYGDERDRTWIEGSAFPDLPSRGGFGDPETQVAACVAGFGLTLVPCYMAHAAGLPRVTELSAEWDIWILVHPDIRKNPRLRVFRDFMADRIRELAPVLEGRA